MPETSQYSSQDGRDLELPDSVSGAVAACANISRKLDTLRTTTATCLSVPLGLVISGFNSMSYSYTSVKGLLQRRDPIRSQNVSLAIRFTQERCQQVAAEVAVILGKHGEWDVLAANGSYHHLNMLSKELEVLKAHHDLLFSTLNLVPVLLRKPAEHESPTSIIIPSFSREWSLQFAAAQWAEHEALQERQRMAYAAAGRMETWSKDSANSFATMRETLGSMKRCLRELLDYQATRELFRGQDSLSATPEALADVEDTASTQSTMEITTPTEDWSNLGSETTEIGRAPAITRHSLQLCGYATASFLRLIEEVERDVQLKPGMRHDLENPVDSGSLQNLHKAYDGLAVQLLHALNAPTPSQDRLSKSLSPCINITRGALHRCITEVQSFLERNTFIEQSFGHLPGSTPVGTADIEYMHKAYEALVIGLLYNLAAPVPFRDHCPAPSPVLASAVARSALSESEKEETHVDKPLEILINSMEATPTDRDIMKLVFHWTTLNECNGYTRADVMKLT